MAKRDSNTKSEKRIIREKVIQLRKELSKEDIVTKSREIKNRLFLVNEIQQANTILFYISFDNEVSTREMIEFAVQQNKRVVVPKVDKENKQLLFYELCDWEQELAPGTWGILEPKPDCELVELNKIDVIIVPGVVFDKNGYRIGYGGGYYDRFLVKVPDRITIGLGFELQIVEKISYENHDCRIKMLVTEDELFRF